MKVSNGIVFEKGQRFAVVCRECSPDKGYQAHSEEWDDLNSIARCNHRGLKILGREGGIYTVSWSGEHLIKEREGGK